MFVERWIESEIILWKAKQQSFLEVINENKVLMVVSVQETARNDKIGSRKRIGSITEHRNRIGF